MLVAIVVTGDHYYFDALVAVGVVCVALIAYNLWGDLIVKFRNNSPTIGRPRLQALSPTLSITTWQKVVAMLRLPLLM